MSIYIFGSFGTCYETKESDIDIAILFPLGGKNSNFSRKYIWDMGQDLACQLNKEIDLVILNTASDVFRYEILTTGKRIYTSNDFNSNMIENYFCSSYLSFNDLRRELIEAFEI